MILIWCDARFLRAPECVSLLGRTAGDLHVTWIVTVVGEFVASRCNVYHRRFVSEGSCNLDTFTDLAWLGVYRYGLC
jgi:hypothetical protein